MKERPILFSSPMVRAILEGRKTMTRRVIKLDEFSESTTPGYDFAFRKCGLWHDVRLADMLNPPRRNYPGACPYGTIGDRLWVRETWRVGAWLIEDGMVAVDYKADGLSRRSWLLVRDEDQFDRLVEQSCADANAAGLKMGYDENYTWGPGNSPCRWRPSIHMPRWASRITLEITDIRVERAWDITRDDAMEEGVERVDPYSITPDLPPGMQAAWKDYSRYGWASSPVFSFRTLWDSINAKRHPWASNPWAWVVEFRRTK